MKCRLLKIGIDVQGGRPEIEKLPEKTPRKTDYLTTKHTKYSKRIHGRKNMKIANPLEADFQEGKENRRTECSRICRIIVPEKDTETGKYDINIQDIQDADTETETDKNIKNCITLAKPANSPERTFSKAETSPREKRNLASIYRMAERRNVSRGGAEMQREPKINRIWSRIQSRIKDSGDRRQNLEWGIRDEKKSCEAAKKTERTPCKRAAY